MEGSKQMRRCGCAAALTALALMFVVFTVVPGAAQKHDSGWVPGIGQVQLQYDFTRIFTRNDPCRFVKSPASESAYGARPFTLYARMDSDGSDSIVVVWEIRHTEPNGNIIILETGEIDWRNVIHSWCFQKEWPNGVSMPGHHVFELFANGVRIAHWGLTYKVTYR